MSKKKNIPSPAKGRSWKRWAVLCLAATVLVLFGWSQYRQSRPLLVVGGFEVVREEYRWAMVQARDDVLSRHSARGITAIEWDEETELGMPYEMVARRAVELLCEYYAVSTLAVERGYLEDASYEALVRALEEENRQRQEAAESGGIITGLSEFELEQYMKFRAAALRRQFCADDGNPEMAVTAEEIRERYEADKATLYTQADTLTLRFVETGEESAEQVRQLREQTADLGSMAEAVSRMPQLQEYYQEVTVDSGNYAAYARTLGDVLAYAQELDTGEISEVICREDWVCLIECVERTEQDYVPFDSVAPVVENTIRQECYDALVAQRAGEMETSYDPAELYRYTASQLGSSNR